MRTYAPKPEAAPNLDREASSAAPRRARLEGASRHSLAPGYNFASISVFPKSSNQAGENTELNTPASPGRPLDQSSRSYFEQRFRHDFSRVRVHDDSKAAELTSGAGALAFTSGRHIYFGANRYRPDNAVGRLLIGHELAHTVQQESATAEAAAGDSALESHANDAAIGAALGLSVGVPAISSVPPVQFLKVSSGTFGELLEDFTHGSINDDTVKLLAKSAGFMALVKILDQHYISTLDAHVLKWERKEIGTVISDDTGKITKGPAEAMGKHFLRIELGPGRFLPLGAQDNNTGVDSIFVRADTPAHFIQDLSHEATHAARHVSGAVPEPKDLADAVKLGIEDEIAARTSEAQIIAKMPKAIRNAADPTGSIKRPEIERDLSPGFNLTYLELFFFGFEMQNARKTEQLTDDEVKQMQAKADKGQAIVLRPPGDVSDPHSIFKHSDFGDLLVARKTCQNDWIKFSDSHTDPSDPNFAKDKDALLQKHASDFFGNKIAYSPLP